MGGPETGAGKELVPRGDRLPARRDARVEPEGPPPGRVIQVHVLDERPPAVEQPRVLSGTLGDSPAPPKSWYRRHQERRLAKSNEHDRHGLHPADLGKLKSARSFDLGLFAYWDAETVSGDVFGGVRIGRRGGAAEVTRYFRSTVDTIKPDGSGDADSHEVIRAGSHVQSTLWTDGVMLDRDRFRLTDPSTRQVSAALAGKVEDARKLVASCEAELARLKRLPEEAKKRLREAVRNVEQAAAGFTEADKAFLDALRIETALRGEPGREHDRALAGLQEAWKARRAAHAKHVSALGDSAAERTDEFRAAWSIVKARRDLKLAREHRLSLHYAELKGVEDQRYAHLRQV